MAIGSHLIEFDLAFLAVRLELSCRHGSLFICGTNTQAKPPGGGGPRISPRDRALKIGTSLRSRRQDPKTNQLIAISVPSIDQ